MAFDSPRAAMRQGSARQRGYGSTASILAATQSQRPPEPVPPPAHNEFIKTAYDDMGGKMTAAQWRSTANTAVQTHGYDVKDLQNVHSGMLREGQIKRSRVRFTGYQWNHEHGMEKG